LFFFFCFVFYLIILSAWSCSWVWTTSFGFASALFFNIFFYWFYHSAFLFLKIDNYYFLNFFIISSRGFFLLKELFFFFVASWLEGHLNPVFAETFRIKNFIRHSRVTKIIELKTLMKKRNTSSTINDSSKLYKIKYKINYNNFIEILWNYSDHLQISKYYKKKKTHLSEYYKNLPFFFNLKYP